jgi:hypothetical protein
MRNAERRRQWYSELGPGVVHLVGKLCRDYRCGRWNKGSLRPVEVRGWRPNSWKSRRSKIRRFFGGVRNRGCFETGSLEWFNYEF